MFSLDFAGPLPVTQNENRYILVAVEHLTVWPIAMPTPTTTAAVVIDFVKRHIMHSFGPPCTIVFDNASCFLAHDLQAFMKKVVVTWKTTLTYALMSNGRAERIVGTLKRAISKMVSSNPPT